MDFVEMEQNLYNLSFIIKKNSCSSNVWSNFFHRVHWKNDVQAPKNFYIPDFCLNGRHFPHPCAPFHLSEDDCSSWLTWSTVRPNNGEGDDFKMLQLRGDPEEILGNPETKTGISLLISSIIFILPPQQIQWNFAVVTTSGNNPQPKGLLYTPQRMNP
jgi:hypothetical protein